MPTTRQPLRARPRPSAVAVPMLVELVGSALLADTLAVQVQGGLFHVEA